MNHGLSIFGGGGLKLPKQSFVCLWDHVTDSVNVLALSPNFHDFCNDLFVCRLSTHLIWAWASIHLGTLWLPVWIWMTTPTLVSYTSYIYTVMITAY